MSETVVRKPSPSPFRFPLRVIPQSAIRNPLVCHWLRQCLAWHTRSTGKASGTRFSKHVLNPQPLDTPHSAFRIPHLHHGVDRSTHAAMTLIELLIVIVILATLTAAALPILTPTTTERRIREASRELNAYISQAQAKAIASQRPYGVALKRLSSDTGRADDRGVCLEVFMVEQPAPYAGFDENSGVRVALNRTRSGNQVVAILGDNPNTVLLEFVTRAQPNVAYSLPPGWNGDLFPAGVIRPGDVVEVGGNRYQLLSSQPPQVPFLREIEVSSTDGYYVDPNEGQLGNPFRPVIIARPLNNTGQLIQPVADDAARFAEPNTGMRLMEGWLEQHIRNSKVRQMWFNPHGHLIGPSQVVIKSSASRRPLRPSHFNCRRVQPSTLRRRESLAKLLFIFPMATIRLRRCCSRHHAIRLCSSCLAQKGPSNEHSMTVWRSKAVSQRRESRAPPPTSRSWLAVANLFLAR